MEPTLEDDVEDRSEEVDVENEDGKKILEKLNQIDFEMDKPIDHFMGEEFAFLESEHFDPSSFFLSLSLSLSFSTRKEFYSFF
jgi:hypothetical protein